MATPPVLERTGIVPIYLQLKEWMRQQIASGAWPAGFKLTAEADLAQKLDLARGTVRKAIEELIAEGLLTRTHGRGTFVTPAPVEQPLAERFVTHSEALIAQGIAYATHVIEQRQLPAPPTVAAQLGVAEGSSLFFLKRTRSVDGVPLLLLHNYVVVAHCPGIAEVDFTRYRLFEVLEGTCGLRLEWGKRTFQAQVADANTAALLDIHPGAALMHIAQTTYLKDDGPVEFSDVWLRGNRFRLAATVQRHGPPGLDILCITPTNTLDHATEVTR
jgi:DNA-binding GntR family transcriptional regulator